MNALDALETLRRNESALRARGIRHAALFGSVARGDNRPDSDIDIFVEFDPAAHVTVSGWLVPTASCNWEGMTNRTRGGAWGVLNVLWHPNTMKD